MFPQRFPSTGVSGNSGRAARIVFTQTLVKPRPSNPRFPRTALAGSSRESKLVSVLACAPFHIHSALQRQPLRHDEWA